MEVKVKFNDINVKEEKEKTLVKILMLKGEKGDSVSAEWGTISGNLENQTDLKNALDSKANQSEVTQALNQKANSSDLNNYYNKSQIDIALGSKLGTEDIEDSLDSTSSDKVLSANQGKILKDQVDEKITSYDNVASMKADTKLKSGMHVKTKGYYNANDNGNAEYLIREKTNEDKIDNGSIHLLQNGLVAELVIKDYITFEMFGAYGDNLHDDTNNVQNALNTNKKIKLIDDKTYLISQVFTTNISNINMYATNKSTIKWNITTTGGLENYTGMISDDDLSATNPVGGNISLKNIVFNGNGENIAEFPVTQLFGLVVLRGRDNCNIDNCTFINSHCDGFAIRGVKSCDIKNCTFKNIGLYQPSNGTRNGLTIMSYYYNRVSEERTIYYDSPVVNVNNCTFDTIADECIRVDGITSLDFSNSYCKNIGQHIIESGHSKDATDYTVTIKNIIADKVGQAIYAMGADGGPYVWSKEGNINIIDSIFKNMCFQDIISQYARTPYPYIVGGYQADYSTAPNILIKNCTIKSINDTIYYETNQKMIAGKNINIEDSIISYYNNGNSVAMIEGKNVNVVNSKLEYLGGTATSSTLVRIINGCLKLINSIINHPKFYRIGNINNSNVFIENTKFIESNGSTSNREIFYLRNITNQLEFNCNNSEINSSNNTELANVYLFTTDNAETSLKIVKALYNYFNTTNAWNRICVYNSSYPATFNTIANNNKYNV